MLLAKNKKGLRNYEVVQKYLAGIVLFGYEVKALREGSISFDGSYIKFEEKHAMLVGVHIGRYSKQSQDLDKLNPKRDRKLLLNKYELWRLRLEIKEKGRTAIPLAFLLKNNLVKVEIAVAKGHKKHEKKHLEKERQIKKDLERMGI